MENHTQQFDVIVLGAGVSGVSAALTASKMGKKVLLLNRSVGASAVSSGAWDLGRVTFKSGEPPNYDEVKTTYRKILLENEKVKNFLFLNIEKELKNLWGNHLLEFNLTNGFLLPTSLGTWKQTIGAQKIQTKAELSNLKGKKVAFVCGRGWRFQHQSVLKHWMFGASSFSIPVEFVPIELQKFYLGDDISLSHVAARLAASGGDKVFREDVQQVLQRKNFDFAIFPPVFLNTELPQTLEQLLRIPICECLSSTEPVAGFRLSEMMKRMLSQSKVKTVETRDVRANLDLKKVKSVHVTLPDRSAVSFHADHFVLATGKYFSSGINFGYHDLIEPIFRCPLFFDRSGKSAARREELSWKDAEFREEQVWAKVGVWVNEKFQVLGNNGKPFLENLYACGSLIGGVDYAREGIGLGFVSLTGRYCASSIFETMG